jgi:hypothetical protein
MSSPLRIEISRALSRKAKEGGHFQEGAATAMGVSSLLLIAPGDKPATQNKRRLTFSRGMYLMQGTCASINGHRCGTRFCLHDAADC